MLSNNSGFDTTAIAITSIKGGIEEIVKTI
jgi:hypothetical protein